jgi:general secretion pathway protein I
MAPTAMSRRRASSRAGFTLIETLVALLILAAFVAVVPGAIVAAKRDGERSRDLLEGGLALEAVLHGDLAGGDLSPGTRRGVTGGHPWSATIGVDEALLDKASQAPWLPLRVSVTVDLGRGQRLTASTVRIGRRP